MDDVDAPPEPELLASARRGSSAAFERLVASYLRREGVELAFACYQGDPEGDHFRLGAINLLSLRAGRIVEIAGFLDPGLHRRFGLPEELPDRVKRGSER